MKKTNIESIVYHLTTKGKSAQYIARQINKSIRTVFYYRSLLRKKGKLSSLVYNKNLKNCIPFCRGYTSASHKKILGDGRIRLHGTVYKIDKLKTPRRGNKQTYNILVCKGHKILCYDSSIMVYLNASFYADDEKECADKASSYLLELLKTLQDRYGLYLLKDGKANIHIVKEHYARMQDETAKLAEEKQERIIVKDRTSGKERFITDHSHTAEAETVHQGKALADMEYYRGFIEDLLENRPEHLSMIMYGVLQALKGVEANAKTMALHLKQHH